MMNYLVILLCTIGSTFASYFLKRAAGDSVLEVLKNKYLYFGGMLYLCVSLTTVWLLQRMPYTIVIPLGSLSFVWTLILSRYLLNEKITWRKVSGIAMIILGVILVAA